MHIDGVKRLSKEDAKAYTFYAFLIVVVLLLSGCHKHVRTTIPDKDTVSPTTMEPVADTAVSPAPANPPATPVISDPLLTISREKSIYFDYDRWTITSQAVDELESVAKHINRTGEKINIFGYCDERGTVEYNQALGMRRAKNVKSILTTLGLNPESINSVVSYGKEKPVCNDHTEDCWQKNRRVDVVVVR